MTRRGRASTSNAGKHERVPWDERIRAIRRKLDLSQEALAHELGLTAGAIRNWEKGANLPGRRARMALRDLLERTGLQSLLGEMVS